MRKLAEEALDIALDVRRGKTTMKDVPDQHRADVTLALGRVGVLAPHARKREHEARSNGSRFSKPTPERARFA